MLKSQLINTSVSANIHLHSYTEQAAENTYLVENLWVFPVGENDLKEERGFH